MNSPITSHDSGSLPPIKLNNAEYTDPVGFKDIVFRWHDATVTPPKMVPLIIIVDGKHKAAEFDGEKIRMSNGRHIWPNNESWGPIVAIAWQVD